MESLFRCNIMLSPSISLKCMCVRVYLWEFERVDINVVTGNPVTAKEEAAAADSGSTATTISRPHCPC